MGAMMRKTFGLLMLTALAAPASAFDFKPLLQADARAGHETEASTAQDNFAWDGQLFFLPSLGFGSAGSFLPLFAYLRDDRDVVVEEDSMTVERDTFLARPLYRYSLSPSLDLKAWGSAKRAVTLESYQVAWSEGLYDYEEYGGGVGVTYKRPGKDLTSADLGLELLHRGYPNWHESGVSLTAGANYYDKDYDGTKLTLSLAGPGGPGWGWHSDWTYLYRGYTDALLEDINGFQPGTSREDQFIFSESHLTWMAGAWTADLDLELTANLSNENYIDTSAAQYMSGFYDFESELLGPSITYAPRGPAGPSLILGLSILNRTYLSPGGKTGRLIRNDDGTYAQADEADVEQRYHIDGGIPLGAGLSLVGNADYTVVQSNQSVIGTYRPAYDLFRFDLGLRYRL
jgi:hypothetical protein